MSAGVVPVVGETRRAASAAVASSAAAPDLIRVMVTAVETGTAPMIAGVILLVGLATHAHYSLHYGMRCCLDFLEREVEPGVVGG